MTTFGVSSHSPSESALPGRALFNTHPHPTALLYRSRLRPPSTRLQHPSPCRRLGRCFRLRRRLRSTTCFPPRLARARPGRPVRRVVGTLQSRTRARPSCLLGYPLCILGGASSCSLVRRLSSVSSPDTGELNPSLLPVRRPTVCRSRRVSKVSLCVYTR